MSWVDYSILGILLLSILVGLLRGFVREVLGIATWVAAFVAAWMFGDLVADRLSPMISQPQVRMVAGHALLFFGALFVGSLISHLVGTLVRDGVVASIDRTLGAGFGLMRGVAAIIFVVMLADVSAATRETRWWNDSVLIPRLLPFANAMRGWFPERWLAPLKSASASHLNYRTSAGLAEDASIDKAAPVAERK